MVKKIVVLTLEVEGIDDADCVRSFEEIVSDRGTIREFAFFSVPVAKEDKLNKSLCSLGKVIDGYDIEDWNN